MSVDQVGMPDVHGHGRGVIGWGEFFREEEIAKKKQRFPGGYTITYIRDFSRIIFNGFPGGYIHQGFFTDHFQWFPGGYTITLHQGVSRTMKYHGN